jgi:hypothetical protein
MDFLKVAPGSNSEACPTSSCVGSLSMSIKVELVTDIQKEEEKDPLLLTFPVIKAEHEVSYMCVCLLLGTFKKYPILPTVFHLHLSLYPPNMPPLL